MRDFDYFDDRARPASWDELASGQNLPDGLEEHLDHLARRARRYRRSLWLMGITLIVCVSFLWGHLDAIRYAFSSVATPADLGDSTTFTPAEIPHNSFVRIRGITEARGLRRKSARGLSFVRKEYWYYQLLGAQGTFVEVEADPKRYGFATEIDVQGRAVDPDMDSSYADLLERYFETFVFARTSPHHRIIQVGLRPGDEQLWYSLALLFLLAVLVSNLGVAYRLVQTRARLRSSR